MNQQAYRVEDFLDELNHSEIKNAPNQLFVCGDADLLRKGRRVSVVGPRKATQAAIRSTRSLVKDLVRLEIVVVSGLAEGVDTVAHRATIEFGGRTIAVIGTPLDQCYPAKNSELQRRLMADHAVVSQFATGSRVTPKNFPMRNRTMALLTDATVIVDAGEKSGTRHQGWEALRLGRDVFVLNHGTQNPSPTWMNQLFEYGAQYVTQEELSSMIHELPAYTNRCGLDAIDF